MKTISILSQKGGSGKTTSTLAIAGAAHAQGKTVVVLDNYLICCELWLLLVILLINNIF